MLTDSRDLLMDYLKINNLLYEYFLRNEEGDILGINEALKDINLSVSPGEFVSVLGRNGSGKSTLAKLINALLAPASGTVFVDGMDTKDSENILEIRTRTGMVFQNPDNQIVAGVVEEDVAFGPENIGVPSEEIRTRVKDSLNALSMWPFHKKSPNHLSGGQKQRVAVAGILAMKPKCIILDEATSMLDPKGRKDVINVALDLNRNHGIGIILITHNMEETIYSNRIFVMDKGHLVMEGTPRDIFSRGEALTELGLTLPEITHVAEGLRAKGLPISSGILTREELVKEIKDLYINGNNS